MVATQMLLLLVAVMAVDAAAQTSSGTGEAVGRSKSPRSWRAPIAARPTAPTTSAASRRQMLAFIGIVPGMVAVDLSSGGGYTTELIARAVGPTGRVYGQSAPRNAPPSPPAAPEGAAFPTPQQPPRAATPAAAPTTTPMRLAERAKNPAAGNIVSVVQKFEDPVSARRGFERRRSRHADVQLSRPRATWASTARQMNKAVFAALKPGGMYVIADHSGRPGTGISESGTLHRVEEAFLRKEVEAAGFKLVAEGNFMRNPSDPRDKNTPDPPQPKDEFVLKFVKP